MKPESNIFKIFLAQLAQTQITSFFQEIKQAANNKRSEAENLRRNQLVGQQLSILDTSTDAKPTAPVGPKSDRMQALRE